jgi:hypothetical protein
LPDRGDAVGQRRVIRGQHAAIAERAVEALPHRTS